MDRELLAQRLSVRLGKPVAINDGSGRTIPGQLILPFRTFSEFGAKAGMSAPELLVASLDVIGLLSNTTVTAKGKEYKIRDIQPTGIGWTTLELKAV